MAYLDKEKRNAYFKKWYAKNKDKHMGYVRNNSKKYEAKADELKSGPCSDCGKYFPPCVMDWDHVRGEKTGTIASMRANHTMAKLRKEIEKCDLVCANCHRIRTHISRRGQ